jgi:hypothetical protein
VRGTKGPAHCQQYCLPVVDEPRVLTKPPFSWLRSRHFGISWRSSPLKYALCHMEKSSCLLHFSFILTLTPSSVQTFRDHDHERILFTTPVFCYLR